MSKRDGDTSVYQYQESGYLPEVILNFMALIGWNPGTPQEIFTKEELMHEDISAQRIDAIIDSHRSAPNVFGKKRT